MFVADADADDAEVTQMLFRIFFFWPVFCSSYSSRFSFSRLVFRLFFSTLVLLPSLPAGMFVVFEEASVW